MTSSLNFGTVTFYDNYAICIINEGENISIEKNRILIELALNYYKGKSFSFIVNREYSYSVDPMIYREISKIDTLTSIAVASTKSRIIESCQIEKLFSTKPFELFTDINIAIKWATNILSIDKKNPNNSSKINTKNKNIQKIA